MNDFERQLGDALKSVDEVLPQGVVEEALRKGRRYRRRAIGSTSALVTCLAAGVVAVIAINGSRSSQTQKLSAAPSGKETASPYSPGDNSNCGPALVTLVVNGNTTALGGCSGTFGPAETINIKNGQKVTLKVLANVDGSPIMPFPQSTNTAVLDAASIKGTTGTYLALATGVASLTTSVYCPATSTCAILTVNVSP